MLCWPALSCCNFSRWLLGGILRSRKSDAASIICSFRYTMRRNWEDILLGGLASGFSQNASKSRSLNSMCLLTSAIQKYTTSHGAIQTCIPTQPNNHLCSAQNLWTLKDALYNTRGATVSYWNTKRSDRRLENQERAKCRRLPARLPPHGVRARSLHAYS